MMKKTIILMLFIIIANFVKGQTTEVTLDLPNPCSTVKVEDIQKESMTFDLSPNPTDGMLLINFTRDKEIGKVKIEIIDTKGISVFSDKIYSNNTEFVKRYNLKRISKGIYYVSIIGKDYIETKQLIKI